MESLLLLLAQGELLLLFVVIVLGLLLSRVKLAGVQLGPAAVLFAGIALSAWLAPEGELRISHQLKDLGLVLFVYCVGLASGPGFFSALRSDGLRLNLGVLIALTVGAVCALASGALFGLDAGHVAGVFSGALTNTPALGAASDRLRGSPEALHAALAYSVTYPFGVLGALLMLRLFAQRHRDALAAQQARERAVRERELTSQNFEVTNEQIAGRSIGELRVRDAVGVMISRVGKPGKSLVPTKYTVLKPHTIVTAVGPKDALTRAASFFGAQSVARLETRRETVDMRRILMSHRELVGSELGALDLERRFNAQVTRLRRGDLELLPTAHTRLQLGDRLRVVAPVERLPELSVFFGDSERALSEMTQPISLRCCCGAVRGSVRPDTSGTRVVCYCDDCRAYLRHLRHPEFLDAAGGSDIFQLAPGDLLLTDGMANVACVRLSPRGRVRSRRHDVPVRSAYVGARGVARLVITGLRGLSTTGARKVPAQMAAIANLSLPRDKARRELGKRLRIADRLGGGVMATTRKLHWLVLAGALSGAYACGASEDTDPDTRQDSDESQQSDEGSDGGEDDEDANVDGDQEEDDDEKQDPEAPAKVDAGTKVDAGGTGTASETESDASAPSDADSGEPETPTAPTGPVDGDPSKPVVSIPEVPCGPGRASFGQSNLQIGGRDVILTYPCEKREGAHVTFILNLHGTTPEAARFYSHGYFAAYRLATSHNLIVLEPKSRVDQWGNQMRYDPTAAAEDRPHLLEAIDWVYEKFSKFNITGMWVAGHSWGSFYAKSFACDEDVADKVKGVIGQSGGTGLPGAGFTTRSVPDLKVRANCQDFISQIHTAGDQDSVTGNPDQTAAATKHGCDPKAAARDLGDNQMLEEWPNCDPGWVHENILMGAHMHTTPINPEVVEHIIERVKSTEQR